MIRENHRRSINARLAVVLFALACLSRAAAAQPVEPPGTPPNESALLAPPAGGPIEVRAAFQLLSISGISDVTERVTFAGILTLVWKDPRQAFDSAKEGVSEKVFSGNYQFDELAPAWYPQTTLANASGQYDSRAVLLRVRPDGTSTLSEELEITAKVNLDMRRFPLDRQRLEVVFRIFGFDADTIAFDPRGASASTEGALTEVPQWTLTGIDASTRTIDVATSNIQGAASAFVVTMDVKRQPMFMLRLVVVPLCLIVVLSWSVFWMDRSSVGDRMSVSFVGILTAVAYQITLVGIVPNVSYFTLMNGFLNLSFLLMSVTVVINLYVGIADRHGHERGDRIDRRCRWLFPLIYFGLIATMLTVAVLAF